MRSSRITSRRFARTACMLSAGVATVIGLTLACNLAAPPGGTGSNGSQEPGHSVDCLIANIPGNIQVSSGAELPLLVFYSVDEDATNVRGFYVPVAGADADSEEIGDDVVVAEGLSAGSDQTFSLDLALLPEGFHRVGILATVNGDDIRCLSLGTLEVTEADLPEFVQPSSDMTVEAGQDVQIEFDMHDPAGALHWRLYYIGTNGSFDAPADELGTQIRTGQGNSDIVSWNTSLVPPGSYLVGLSTTDSGHSIAETVAAGDGVRTIMNPFLIQIVGTAPPIPGVNVTEPDDDQPVVMLGDQRCPPTINVEFTVSVWGSGAAEPLSVEVFVIDEGTDTEHIIQDGLDIDASPVSINTSTLPSEGPFSVGVRVVGSSSGTATGTADGKIEFENPAVLITLSPNTVRVGGTADVSWTTNVNGCGTPTGKLVVQRVDADGAAVGSAVETALTDDEITAQATPIEPASNGLFDISVVLTYGDTALTSDIAKLHVTDVAKVWLGNLATKTGEVEGAIFEGVQPEDNVGAAGAGGTDFDGNDIDDFLVVARYGKPNFANPSGIGIGEAYLIAGQSQRYRGRFNLNSVGSSSLPGMVFTGIDPATLVGTEGITRVYFSEDADTDNVGEIVFSFPYVDSPGWTEGSSSYSTLTKSGQFKYGGIVVASSQNSAMRYLSGGRIRLDSVGRNFTITSIQPEPVDGKVASVCELVSKGGWSEDYQGWSEGECENLDQGDQPPNPDHTIVYGTRSFEYTDACLGSPELPFTDDTPDTLVEPAFGFDSALAIPFQSPCIDLNPLAYPCPAAPNGPISQWDSEDDCYPENVEEGINAYGSFNVILPSWNQCDFEANGTFVENLEQTTIGSGFYPDRYASITGAVPNEPEEPYGARFIGISTNGAGANDRFGTCVSESRGELFVSAPNRSTLSAYYHEMWESIFTGDPDAGVAYLFSFSGRSPDYSGTYWQRSRLIGGMWPPDVTPPKPHQYIAGGVDSSCGRPPVPAGESSPERVTNYGTEVAGSPSDHIEEVLGVPDFNNDGREDLVVGAPRYLPAGGRSADGRLYILPRRSSVLEGDYVLEKRILPVDDPWRLDGLVVRGNKGSQLGFNLAGNMDFNGDGVGDVVAGAPYADLSTTGTSLNTGEVVIIFGNENMECQAEGEPIEDMLKDGRAARITGIDSNGLLGFNIINGGDIDGNGTNDLVIAAPGATPRFNTSAASETTAFGLDMDGDYTRDAMYNISASGFAANENELIEAGLVYIIFVPKVSDAPDGPFFAASWGSTANPGTISISELGTEKLPGAVIVGRRPGDRIGGGDVGDSGILAKKDAEARTYGLAAAGDVDGDGKADIIIGSVLADPRRSDTTGLGGEVNGGEAYLIYGFSQNQ